MPELTDQQIQKIIQDAQAAAQQVAAQALQAAQQTGGSLAADKKVLGTTVVTEDTQTDEATRGKTYVDSEMWGLNKKLLTEREQDTARKSFDYDKALKEIELKTSQLELARKQADFNHAEQLKAIAISEAQQAAVIKHLVNLEYTKFNAAVSEPINPNIGAAYAAKAAAKKK